MTELDFDELDKAVSSLMGSVDTSKRAPGLDDPEDKVVTLNVPSSDSADTPKASVPNTDQASPIVDSPAPATPPALKRRGQFMDVIRPTTVAQPTSAPVSRQGITLQPSPTLTEKKDEPVVRDEAPVTESVPSEAAVASLGMEMESTGTGTPPAVAPESGRSETDNDPSKKQESSQSPWPDPIDFAQKVDDMGSTPNDDIDKVHDSDSGSSDVAADLPHDVVAEVAAPNNQEPLVSPFLPDAKVEKRPLGAPTTERSEVADETVTDAVTDATDEAPTEGHDAQATEQFPATPIPEELKGEIIALESSDVVTAVTEGSATTRPVAQESSGPQSIPQQYTEKPSTGNQSNTPIFDTSTHTEPLAAPKKKTSILRWIIIIFLLLIVGAAGGAAFFYFTTQM